MRVLAPAGAGQEVRESVCDAAGMQALCRARSAGAWFAHLHHTGRCQYTHTQCFHCAAACILVSACCHTRRPDAHAGRPTADRDAAMDGPPPPCARHHPTHTHGGGRCPQPAPKTARLIPPPPPPPPPPMLKRPGAQPQVAADIRCGEHPTPPAHRPGHKQAHQTQTQHTDSTTTKHNQGRPRQQAHTGVQRPCQTRSA
jgi:hypothetical protein